MNNAAPARRKIAIVVPKYGLVGGGERFVSEVAARMAQDPGLELHVLANQWTANSDRIRFHKIPILRFPRFLRPLSFAWFVQQVIRREKFDLVHSHHWIFHADVFSAHGTPHAQWVKNARRKRPSLYDRALSYVERQALKNGAATIFMPVSSIAMQAFRDEYATLPGRWEIMHPGVDVERFNVPDRAECRAEIRGRYGIGMDDLLLLFVGMNFEIKGLDTIIAAVAKAQAARPDIKIRLLAVGRGNEKKYGKIAHTLGIGDAVTFAGTQTSGLERYYRASDAFVLFSAFDTFGMVVLEAMAAGLPVIVSPNVGAKDLVDGANGYVLPGFRDSDTAAEYIVRLFDPSLRADMGRAAQAKARGQTWEQLTEKMHRVYRETGARLER